MGRPPLRLGRPKGRPQAPFQPSHENRYPFTNWSTFAPPKWSKFTPPLTELYRKIITQGSETYFSGLPRMHLLYFLQMFIRQGYSYPFFAKAIEDAALRIDDSSLEKETKAYALFFLNVAYIDISEGETFDFMLSRIQKDLPVDLQLALGHEAKNVKERTKLMRRQDKRLRRMLPRGNALNMFMKNLYERPVNAVIQQSLKAQKKKEEKKADKLSRQSRK